MNKLGVFLGTLVGVTTFSVQGFAQPAKPLDLPESNEVWIEAFDNGQITITSTNVSRFDPRLRHPPRIVVPTKSLDLLSQKTVQKELELSESQLKEFNDWRMEIKKRRNELFKNLPNPALICETMEIIESQTDDKLKEILLPHQEKRLKQLKLQMMMRSQGSTALIRDAFEDALEITDEQKKQLAEKHKEAEAELLKKIEEIRESLQKEIRTEVLTKEQIRKLDELLGESFSVYESD